MTPGTLVVAGIDLAAGRGITEVAVLTAVGPAARPSFDAGAHAAVATNREICDVIAAAAPAVIAIDAPLTLPRPVAAAVRELPGAPISGGVAPSPYTRAAERSPVWGQIGMRPLPVSFLGGLTFRAIALLPELRAAAPDATIIECFPTATLRQLGVTSGAAGRGSAGRASKTSAEARSSVQRGLARLVDGVPDPATNLLGADLLDALAAALTALAFACGDSFAVGDEDEGQIMLPQRDAL